MLPRWVKWGTALMVAVVTAAMAFAVFEPIQVLPRMRLAPGYALTDQAGEPFTSETARGSVTLYAFTTLDCGEVCDRVDAAMRTVRDRRGELDFGDVPLRLVTVVVDPSTTAQELSTVAADHDAEPADWAFVSGDPAVLETTVGAGFDRFLDVDAPDGIAFDAGYVIVDPAGIVRGDYRYSTLAEDADKLVRHLGILGAELRYADGAAGFAFDAAHLFLCYP